MESFLRPLQIICGGRFISVRLRIMAGKRENSRVWTLRHLWRIVPVGPLHNQNIDVSDVWKRYYFRGSNHFHNAHKRVPPTSVNLIWYIDF